MSSPLPPGWVEATDPKSGRRYFANPSTRETRWELLPRVSTSVVWNSGSRERSEQQRSNSGSRGRSGKRERSGSGSRGVSSRTTRSTSLGQAGNKLYTAPDVNEAIKTPSKLVRVARSMLDKSAAFPAESVASDVELNSLTVGQIADLCRIQHETDTCGDNLAYTPLNPYRMSGHGPFRSKEEGRLDVRLFALNEKLAKYQGETNG